MTELIDPTISHFVERLGFLAERQGSSRTFGRIFALLMTANRPLSFAEIVERLQISRGGMSMNTRRLIELGLVNRVNIPGERQDYFELPDNLWNKLFEQQMQRDRDLLGAISALTSASVPLSGEVQANLQQLAQVLDLSLKARLETMAPLCRGEGRERKPMLDSNLPDQDA